MIKKSALILFLFLFCAFAQVTQAKDVLQFDFPNEGWHKIECPNKIQNKKCFAPFNQSQGENNEILMLSEQIVKNEGLNAMIMLQKQLGKDKNNYRDIIPEYVVQEENNSIALWCSKQKNTCSVLRTFKGKEGIVSAIYLNKAPHYSQNMFGQWSNILSKIEVYDKSSNTTVKNNLIELD